MNLNRTLLTHYYRHPVQALFLLAGIVTANVLLTGTLLINAQARASYEMGEHLLTGTPIGQIQHVDRSQSINESDYVRLRRQGFDMLAPLLRQVLRTDSGQIIELMGIDVFAIPRSQQALTTGLQNNPDTLNFVQFAFPPYQLWAAPSRLKQLDLQEGVQIRLSSGEMLPPLSEVGGQQLGHHMLIDLSALQALTGSAGEVSSILVFPSTPERLSELRAQLPDTMVYVGNDETPDPAELTRSFHLNLAAMGLLAFVVGIFLTYNALTFNYTDRRDLIRKLRLSGVFKTELASALLIELFLFLVVGTLIGTWLGAQLAAWLLPGVGQTLATLYGVYIAYPDGLVPSGIWLPLLMTAVATGLCVLFPFRETLRSPMLDRQVREWQMHSVIRRDRLLTTAGCLLLLITFAIGFSTRQLWIALFGMACLLLGAALLLPAVLRSLIGGLERLIPSRWARTSWLLTDGRWLLGPASLALMAMTLALVANSGLNTMIHSFRSATDDWLNQRLVADLYLRAQQELTGFEQWLAVEMPELRVAERYGESITRLSPSGQRVVIGVVSLPGSDRFRTSVSLMQVESKAMTRFENGEGVYISERAWRIEGWQTGDYVNLCQGHTGVPIVGVYRDYGNPNPQWMVSQPLFRACWPQQAAAGLSVSGPKGSDWGRVRAAIAERYDLDEDRIIDQTELRTIGLAVFDRTFAVTRALNALTLLVAAIGIFCAISAIHHHRVGHQALLSSLGLTRCERGSMLMLQWGMLGLLCMVLVWPFATMLAAYLGSVVTPAAFGWSFPLKPEWQHYLVLAALASACLMLAVLLPSLRLLRTSAATMLREQNL
jgi:putative ABC transport system permease protein